MREARSVGIVGAGQLARMTCEAASFLGIRTVVLAASSDDPAAGVATEVLVGHPGSEKDLRRLAERCDVITFDHEQVDLDLLAALPLCRPGIPTLQLAVDKSRMRAALSAAGLPCPAFAVVTEPGQVADFADHHGWPVMLKSIRGGYDGRGVWPAVDLPSAAATLGAAAGAPLLVEEMVDIDIELAVLVARRPGGEIATWPAVETAQVDGMCREILVPGQLDPQVAGAARRLAIQVAELAGAVGVLAIELFASRGRLTVNEIAARPHNSGHWTIEGSVTSQFENHLRAVLDLPLGATEPTAPHVATVNLVGQNPDPLLPAGLAVPSAHLHLYRKDPRPGRKLGHVTVCGSTPTEVRHQAWAAARALGTEQPAAIPA